MDTNTASLRSGDNPLCSVCIANFNGIGIIDACLNSVLEQDLQMPIEVIVHDDASTDGSVEFIKQHYPQVQLLVSSQNVGFCVSNNRMVAQSKGEYVLLLNNDAVLHRDALRTLYEFAKTQKLPAILSLPQYDLETGELIDCGSRLDLFLNTIPNLEPKRIQVATVIGACLWIPRELWNNLGGFPEWFGSMAEDVFLCSLARLRGYPVMALPSSGFKHLVGRSFGGGKIRNGALQTSYRRKRLSERNKTYVMAMCYPAPYFFLLFPLHLIILALEGLGISVLQRRPETWKQIYGFCFSQLWKDRADLLKYRKAIQNSQKIGYSFFADVRIIPQKFVLIFQHGLPYLE